MTSSMNIIISTTEKLVHFIPVYALNTSDSLLKLFRAHLVTKYMFFMASNKQTPIPVFNSDFNNNSLDTLSKAFDKSKNPIYIYIYILTLYNFLQEQ